MATKSINIRFPFAETLDGGIFATNSTSERAYNNDLIILLTTRPNQRVMNKKLFSPVFSYLFEPMDDISQQRLNKDLKDKVGEFIPQIDIKKIEYNPKPEENLLGIKITFSIKELFDTTQTIELNFPTDINQ